MATTIQNASDAELIDMTAAIGRLRFDALLLLSFYKERR